MLTLDLRVLAPSLAWEMHLAPSYMTRVQVICEPCRYQEPCFCHCHRERLNERLPSQGSCKPFLQSEAGGM